MHLVVLVLMLTVVIMTMLKLTFLKPWHLLVITAIYALFIGLSWEYAIQQSNNEIDKWLENQQLMLDTSVILTLEVIWQMAYCLLAGKLLYGETVRKRTIWIYRILRFFPGILIFPVLFYMLVEIIYLFPNADFALVAWGFAGVVLIFIPLGTYLLNLLLPEKNIKLEILFLCSALVLILGIVATVNGTTNFKGSDPIEWKALGAFIIIMIISAMAGYFIREYRIKKLEDLNNFKKLK